MHVVNVLQEVQNHRSASRSNTDASNRIMAISEFSDSIRIALMRLLADSGYRVGCVYR